MTQSSQATEDLIRAIYPQLRQIAGRLLLRERGNHTLQKTALIHETFLKLFGKKAKRSWTSEELLSLAAHQMRQILVDYARRRSSLKRGREYSFQPLSDNCSSLIRDDLTIIAVNQAIERLGQMDTRAVAVIELKFFAGFTDAESAKILGISEKTVELIWQHSRLWLYRELTRAQQRVMHTGVQPQFMENYQPA